MKPSYITRSSNPIPVEARKPAAQAPAVDDEKKKDAEAAAAKQAALEAQVKRLAAEQAAQSAKPKMAKLVLSSSPNGAMVHRGDSLLCTTPCDMEVPVGDPNETLMLKLDGYKEYPLKVSLVHGATVALALNLTKAPSRNRNKRRAAGKSKATAAPAAKAAPAARPASQAAPPSREAAPPGTRLKAGQRASPLCRVRGSLHHLKHAARRQCTDAPIHRDTTSGRQLQLQQLQQSFQGAPRASFLTPPRRALPQT